MISLSQLPSGQNQSSMRQRNSTPLSIDQATYQRAGHQLVDQISEFYAGINERPVTPNKSAKELRTQMGTGGFPNKSSSAEELIGKASTLLMENSLLNGHPKFQGYITASPSPIGSLADLLAAAVNPNVGAQLLSPIATEIEKQTIQWLCEFIDVPNNYGGVLVSGGNMANFTAFLAARTAKTPKNFKEEGISHSEGKLLTYCSDTTHTWIEKAAILFGLGTNSIRWIESDDMQRMNLDILKETIAKDVQDGCRPMMVIGTAGDVSTGVVDDLASIAAICKQYDLWFHVDGAYGAPAAIVPRVKDQFKGLEAADSIALDPHKWLYCPLEAGCTLVKNPQHLIDTFSSHPEYYNFNIGDEGLTHNFYEYGLQNSRGFRALKVWLTMQQVGREGYAKTIEEDIELSELLFELADAHPELEAVSQSLSITTLRYVPLEGIPKEGGEAYLNTLNEELLNEMQLGGEAFLSNAVIKKKYCLRSCIVNFRTTEQDIRETVELIVELGRKRHSL
jgi:glutamate/tyrosine decarboxylase-like PLP-dependent enzyme